MSGADGGGGGKKGLLASLMGTLRRSSARQEQPKPVPEDLGLKTLRHAYTEYAKIEHPVEKERQLHRIIPLFCQNCSKFSVQELETRFPEVLDFAEQISLLFVRHVTQIAHPQITSRAGAGLSLLKYFESVDEDDVGSTGGVGMMILRAIHILSNGSDMIVTAMMTSNLCSVLVQCINLFLELPHPAGSLSESRSRSSSSASPATPTMFRNTDEVSASPVFSLMSESSRPPSSLLSLTPTPSSAYSNEMAERQALERLLRSVLDRLVRHMSAVSDLIMHGDLSLLFGAVSRPCPAYNKMWRKAAADCLVAVCRYSLSSEVIDYIHKKGCILFCMRNILKAFDQPPLDVVESIATIFSCLKDSAEISQVLLEDFSSCSGYKFLHDYLLYLERKTSDETREVLRNVVLLIQGLVMAGFLTLEPTITDGGPFQDPGFQIPAPLDPNHTVRNKDAFIVLQDAFIASKTSHLGITIIDAILNIFRSDMSNYFIVQQLQSLSYFVEKITEKKEDVQAHVFKLFEFVMLEINYVATAELTSIGLLLTQRDHPQTLTLVLNFLLRLISYSAKYKMIFAQVGILTMMINALKVYANELKEAHQQTEISSVPSGGVSSPSLPLEDVQGAEEEYVFLLMECLRATIEGNEQNGEVFRENGGTKCTLTLVNYNKPRRLALRLLTQLILLKDGSIDFSALLDLLNQSSQTAVLVKAEVFQTILRIFQLDSSQKGVFRDVCGFHYLISVLASLIGSLAPRRSEPWIGVPRVDILHLVQLIFAVLTSAMHDDPANRSYFEINIRFHSFTAPLLLLGCFDNDATEFPSLSSSSEDLDLHSGSFTSFESEFKTWHPPSKDLSQDSAIYCASEVFRFLRDMSLGIQSHQSTSLIDAMTIGLAREKNFYGAPPVTAARQKAGSSSLHLEHPGAVLCMVDLLPAVGVDEAYADDVTLDEGENVVETELSKEPLSPLSPDNRTGDVPDVITNQLSKSRKEKKKLELEELDMERKDLEKEVMDDECHMTKIEARSWSIFLQERVVSEIYSMALSERNQQALCQIGLPQRILAKCSAVLSSDGHPLHEALERTFEKLSYQSLTPSDFRSFLRLGNPLCCSLNDVTVEDLQSGKYSSLVGGINEPPPSATPYVLRKLSPNKLETPANQPPLIDFSEPGTSEDKPSAGPENELVKVEHDSTNKNAPFGGSLSLARVQSLVSMTTPRDGNQEGMIRNPPFVEFDLSIDGFACLFLPSVFPQSISQASNSQSLQSPAAISGSTSGVGTGSERPFPPSNGLTFSCWLHFTRCSQDEKSLIGLLTLAQTLYLKDRKLHHLPCLRIYLHPEKKQLVATTCQPDPRERRNSANDEVTVKTDSRDKMDEAVFRCGRLFQEHCWHHIVVVINKGMRGRAKVTLFINGQLQETHKMTYIHPLYVNSSTPLLPYPNENTPYLINAFIGTHVTRRSVSKLTYRLGSVFLFEDPLPSNVVQHVYTLGPSYYGAFQAPVLQDRLVSSLVPGSQSDPLPPLIPEDKVVFGLLVTCPLLKTIHELAKAYCSVDVSTIARELSLAEQDNITPITLLHNSAAHLLGPSRTLGAIMCGYSGIRFFEPQPLRNLISSVGGTSVMLGLVAMATTVDNLYASMKALVCIIGDNQVALKEMERTGGFQVLGMLLYSKADLINSHILHLTYTLVGTVDSERSATISNPIAFRDLLANMLIWRATSESIQRSLFNHFYDLLSHNSNRVANAEQMLKMKLVSTLLYHLIMENLCVKTIKLICNVLSTLIALKPEQEDITRIGQLLATTLPSNRATNENSINLYDEESLALSSEHEEVDTDVIVDNAQEKFGRFSGTEGKQRRAIILRNILLEVVLSLLVQEDGLNSSFTRVFSSALGFDWLILFMDASIHAETVSRAVRILIQLLTDPTLRVKFHEGDIFGGWVQGFDSISTDMTRLLSTSVSHFNPLKPSTNSQLSGASILTYILPHHAHVSHIFLLLVASLLGKSSTDIPFSSQFNTETLEDLFSIGDTTNMAHQFKIFTDSAYVLLALTRSLLHQESSDPSFLTCAVDLIKFLTRLYRHVPEFTKFASCQEFIEALASTLFPPPLPPNKTTSTTTDTVEPEADKGDTEWILIETQEMPGVAGQDQREAILKNPDNIAVCTVVKLLRTIAVNGFSSSIQNKESAPVCPIFERVLAATPAGISTDLQNQYQTLILHSIVEYLKSGNEDILILLRSNPHLSQNMERSILGLSVFCSRLVDKVWQDVYLKPVNELYSFFYALVEQARKTPKELPLGDLQRCLNRVILFQVSTVPASEESQKQLMDTLCMFSSQAHCIFDDTNFDNEFLECLTFCLLKIVFAEKIASRYDRCSSPERSASDTSLSSSGEGASKARHVKKKPYAGYVPGSIAMMKSGANRLWTKMLEYKRKELEQILSTELPTPNSNREALPLPLPGGLMASASSAYLRLQNCEHFLTDNLIKAWDQYVIGERSSLTIDSAQKDGRIKSLTGTLWPGGRISRKRKGNSISSEVMVQDYVEILCPLLVLAAQKYFETMLRNYQRNEDYRLRYAMSEWSKIEYELTRERGLWGPEIPSKLDKWMLDTVEGPSRMRKRLCRNRNFYQHYPYRIRKPKVKSKHQQPSSHDSELLYKRELLFQRPTLLTTSSVITSSKELPRIMSVSVMDKEPPGGASQSPAPSPAHMSLAPSRKMNEFSHPDTDDPIAQTIYRMFEPEDKVNLQYQCAILSGLDSRDGVLLLGSSHFYVIEGLTINRYGEIVDIETAHENSYVAVVPLHLRTNLETDTTTKRQISIQCIKWSYDTIREIHKRRYLLRRCAIEVFSSDGRNHFLIFHSQERNKIYQKLQSLSKQSLADSQFVAGIHPEADPEQSAGIFAVLTGEKSLPERWANGEITNFQYLMHLNTLAGRSYNDLMQYPIFPWVLANYSSETLDLTNPSTFRDFSKPMGALDPVRLKRFMERYKHFEDPTGENTPPYYYGTHYSSAMIVASYLIRMEPFTQHFLKLQGGHFDLPDRLFHSIPDAWKSACETNMADVKELIPEFFYLPEFLSNSNHFELGMKQSGVALNDIVLPPWAKGDAHEFIRMHREALECDYVSAHLHEWIDLIFGYKQTGEEALKAHNVFHHLFYEGAVDIDKIEDPVKRNATISFIHNFGQMPKQLFKRPHRQRKVFSSTPTAATDSSASPSISIVDSMRVFYKNLIQLMPSKDPIKEIRGEVNQMVSISDKIPIAVEKNKLLLPPNYNRYFMWGFPDYSARIATVEGDKVTSVFEGLHEGRILCTAAADNNILLTGGESTVVCVWKIQYSGPKDRSKAQLQLKHTLYGHTGPVTCLAASTSYNLIVSGSKDKTCILWDINRFTFVQQLSGHSGPVTIVTINQLNGNIVTCTRNQICLWTVNGTLLAETDLFYSNNFRLLSCTVSELFEWDRENVIVTGSSDGIIRLWVLQYIQEEEELRRRKSSRKSATLSESEFDPTVHGDRHLPVVQNLRRSLTPPSLTNIKEPSSPITDTEEGQTLGNTVNRTNTQPISNSYLDNVIQGFGNGVQQIQDTHEGLHSNKASSLSDLPTNERNSTLGVSDLPILSTSTPPSSRVGDLIDLSSTGITQTNQTGVGPVPHPPTTSTGSAVSDNVFDTQSDTEDTVNRKEDASSDDVFGAEKEKESNKEETGMNKGEKVEDRSLTYYEQFLAEQRRKAEELRQKGGKWIRKLTMVHQLTMHTSFHRKDNDNPASVTSLCISKDHRKLFVGDAKGRIFSWSVSDNLGGMMEHWLRDEAINNCMKCNVEFTFTERKHHCRDCGKIFCAKCSAFESEIERLRINKKVRICGDCFAKLSFRTK